MATSVDVVRQSLAGPKPGQVRLGLLPEGPGDEQHDHQDAIHPKRAIHLPLEPNPVLVLSR
jgi:hypothetical protein